MFYGDGGCEAFEGQRSGSPSNVGGVAFLLHLETEASRLERQLLAESYHPESYRIFSIYEHKPRLICAAPFRDRVVHHAVCAALEPILESYAIFDSYACRIGKGSHRAIARAQSFAKGSRYFLKLDVRKFFASIDHKVLQSMLTRKCKDHRFLRLCNLLIDHGPPEHPLGKGLPIGNLTSQQFANFYLGRMDHFIKSKLRVKRYLRYMDDFLIFADSKAYLWTICSEIEVFLKEELLIELNQPQLAPVQEGIAFLGFRIWPNLLRLNKATKRSFYAKFRAIWKAYENGTCDEEQLVRSSHGLLGHIGHANTYHLRRVFFERLFGEEEDAL